VKYLNRFRVHPGDDVRLKDIDPGFTDDHESHKKALDEIEGDRTKLRALQELLYADGRRSLLICLQGMDTGGKDGTINHILGAMNPQGCRRAAYEEALSRCSTAHAPWFVVPSDHKWFRNLAIARIVVEHLEAMNMKVPEPSVDLDRIRREYHAAKAE
jgi:polyphosphate kinase 2 (PPK2 family)